MSRTTIWAIALTLALAGTAGAAATPQETCQAAKLDGLRKHEFCIEGERRKAVLGKTPDTAKCAEKFATALAKADKAAAKKSTSCRWLDNQDGTATDLHTGLQWEIKTDDGSVHDWDNEYTWAAATGAPFLFALNGGLSTDGSTTTGCFAGHCDWRVPTVGELRSMLEVPCTTEPCTTIPGLTRIYTYDFYWSSSTDSGAPDKAWVVVFYDGLTTSLSKGIGFSSLVRAVRGGSGA